MTESGLIFGLPLLTKDLIEQSARRRTYVLRVVYAAVLYGAALWVYADIGAGGAQGGILNLGRGGELFRMLVIAQFLAIIVLLPALSCGAITSEKERDTLGLLLITQLTPTAIVLEKLLSRLVTISTYQLLSLPLFAVVYGMGGVELNEIVAAIWLLGWWSTLVAAWSIFCSAWHRTTAGAFISAYLMMPLIVAMAAPCGTAVPPPLREIWDPHWGTGGLRFLVSLIESALVLLILSAPLAGMTLLMIVAAQKQLLERAFVPPRNLLLEFFQKLDAFFVALNQQTTRGVILVRDYDMGPLFEPIAWRETRKKSLGTVRYLFRLLVVLEVPLVVAISLTMTNAQVASFDGPTAFFLMLLWPIAALAVAVHATNVLASERSRQTLDVLLVAPLTSKDLVSQKLAGVRRLIGILTIPFATMVIFQAIWTLYVVRGLEMFRSGSNEGSVFIHEILGMSVAMIVYPRLVQWVSFHLALRLKNQTQSVLSSMAVVIGICIAPLLLNGLLEEFGLDFDSCGWVSWLSPVWVLFHRQFVEQYGNWAGHRTPYYPEDELFLGLAGHTVLFVAAWFLLRSRALQCFSRLVGRTEPTEDARESK